MHTAASPPAAPPPDDDSAGRRVNIRGIKELPTGYDAEVGMIFCEMRRASQLTKEQLADQFSTDLSTIDALETGALLALPDWAETSRVVTAYTDALGLDGRPILRRMALQLAPDAIAKEPANTHEPPPLPAAAPRPVKHPEPPPASASDDLDPYDQFDPVLPPPEIAEALAESDPAEQARPHDTASASGRSIAGRTIRWLMVLVMLGAGGFGAWYVAQRPEIVSAALGSLPEPIPRMARAAWELLGPLGDTMAPDPRSRKSDKLPISGDEPANQ